MIQISSPRKDSELQRGWREWLQDSKSRSFGRRSVAWPGGGAAGPALDMVLLKRVSKEIVLLRFGLM